LNNEIAYLQEKTDGLVLDVTRNPGGSTCSLESLARRLSPDTMRSVTMRFRVTWDYLQSLRDELDFLEYFEASPEEIDIVKRLLDEGEAAYKESRGMSPPAPICSYSADLNPPLSNTGEKIAYSKPILLLVDELSVSAAEAFAAIMQDNRRATLFGYRTAGAGGAVDNRTAGIFSETSLNFAFTIIVRQREIATGEYPVAPYIENIGVRPDKEYDAATEENLLRKGKPFVDAFTAAAVELFKASKQN
jgi:C-terminal processing protease CtpA/Prc